MISSNRSMNEEPEYDGNSLFRCCGVNMMQFLGPDLGYRRSSVKEKFAVALWLSIMVCV